MSSVTKRSRFPELVQIQAPRGMNAALEVLAARQHTTKSEVLRRSAYHALESAGLSLSPERERVLA